VTQYVLSEIDDSVDAVYGVLQELDLVNEGDTTDYITFGRGDMTDTPMGPDYVTDKCSGVKKQDDLLVVLNGSGNYHHLTYGFCRGILEQDGNDYTVLHFDRHGDSRGYSWMLDCGNFLGKLVRDSDHAKKGIIIGADDMVTDSKWMEPAYLSRDTLEVYPFKKEHGHFHDVQSEPTVDCVEKEYDSSWQELNVKWHTIKREGIDAITHRALDRTDTENVYITVDLDALQGKFVHTDWGNGKMSLDQLLDSIALVREEKNIIGLDVTGTDGTNENERTAYTIAAIVNEVTDGPYERKFFQDRIKKARRSDFWNGVKEFFS